MTIAFDFEEWVCVSFMTHISYYSCQSSLASTLDFRNSRYVYISLGDIISCVCDTLGFYYVIINYYI